MTNALTTTPESPRVQRSLYRFLAVVVFVSIAVPAVISGGILIHENYQRTISHDSVATANGYADLLEAGMSIPLWNVSPGLGQPIIESVFVDPAVLSVVVDTENGERFLEYIRANNSEVLDQDAILLTRDVTYNDTKLGQVEISYSLKSAEARATNEAKLLAIILAVQLVFSLATISVVLHRRVVSPLKKLGKSAAGIAGGDLRTAIPTLKNDEFGQLSQRLETMRGALEENFTQLEQRVDERTSELRSVNQAMRNTLDQLREAQNSLIQQEKLAALGSLVAGVAHELNTPIGNGLTVASSLVDTNETMNQQMASGLTRSGLQRYLADMEEGCQMVCRNLQKASELVSSFKQVAMDRTSTQRRKFSLEAILNETLLTVSPAFKRTPYKVQLEVAEDSVLDSYPGPLGQVVTNLLNNAVIHAFDGQESGLVVVRTEKCAHGVQIEVEDDGVGITAENKSKIFDPFFTTKLGAGGSGLGMHIVHNIVTGVLGGSIEVQSELGQGTRFTLYLPYTAPGDEILYDEDLISDASADGKPSQSVTG